VTLENSVQVVTWTLVSCVMCISCDLKRLLYETTAVFTAVQYALTFQFL